MLKNNEKIKIENYIQRVINGLLEDTEKSRTLGMNDKQIIDRITEATVNKVTPESKMIMSTVYNMLMETTLSEDLFQNPANRALFYERDILKDLNSNFSFTVPSNIDYNESKDIFDNRIKGGSIAVIIVGGVVSVKIKSLVPFGISIGIVFAAIMGIILFNKKKKGSIININELILEYLNSVKALLIEWIESIEIYYDEEIKKLKEGI